MASYVMLVQLTQQGVENIKEVPSRLANLKQLFKDMDCELKEFYFLMGCYDGLIFADIKSAEKAAGLALAIEAGGNGRVDILRAFTSDEYKRIVASIP